MTIHPMLPIRYHRLRIMRDGVDSGWCLLAGAFFSIELLVYPSGSEELVVVLRPHLPHSFDPPRPGRSRERYVCLYE